MSDRLTDESLAALLDLYAPISHEDVCSLVAEVRASRAPSTTRAPDPSPTFGADGLYDVARHAERSGSNEEALRHAYALGVEAGQVIGSPETTRAPGGPRFRCDHCGVTQDSPEWWNSSCVHRWAVLPEERDGCLPASPHARDRAEREAAADRARRQREERGTVCSCTWPAEFVDHGETRRGPHHRERCSLFASPETPATVQTCPYYRHYPVLRDGAYYCCGCGQKTGATRGDGGGR